LYGYIDEDQYRQLISSINDRNLTSHAYREDVATQIASHIFAYYQLMQKIMHKIKAQLN
jgi:hypothetical protein